MRGQHLVSLHPRPLEAEVFDAPGAESCDDPEDWDGLGPSSLWDDLWDAFDLDDETAEPQPEYGDFWGRSDRDEDP